MDLLWSGLLQAIRLLLAGDPEVLEITGLSLMVSGGATLVALLVGVPAGTGLALTRFPGRNLLITLVNTGMGLPPVVVGLFVTLLLWRSGPLGALRLLFTPGAMVLAQVLIAAPVVAGLTLAGIQGLHPQLRLQLLALGASPLQAVWVLLREARLALLAAVMAGFGAVISEVGAVMMVGGNIRGQTRVLTTATVLEARMGHFELAIALGVILLALSFGVNLILTALQQRR